MRACRLCRRPFFICAACDRGHAYCGPACRREGRARSLRAAGRRHQQSPEGRLDHRDRQRVYEARLRAGLTHQTSQPARPCGILLPRPLPPSPSGGPPRGPGGRDAHRLLSGPPEEPAPRCVVCGRCGGFAQWTEEIPRRWPPRRTR